MSGNQHPRFPRDMAPDVRRTIADEVDVTLAGFPSKRPLEQAITAYAEQLDGFLPDEIRGGFRDARRQASDWAPTPPQVYVCVSTVRRLRLEAEARSKPQPPEEPRVEIPAELRQLWRDALGGRPTMRQMDPIEYQEGREVQQKHETPLSAIVTGLNPT